MPEKQDANSVLTDYVTFNSRQLARTIRPLFSSIIDEIIKNYALNLLLEDDNYVVRAVWGPIKSGSLDHVQCDINNRINLFITEIRNWVIPNEADPGQEFAVEFLIREKFLFHMSFLLERGRRWATLANYSDNSDKDLQEAAFNAFMGKIGNA